MAIIYSYPLNDNIKPLDELVGTTEKIINGQLKTVTRNFLLQDLAEFFIVDGGLQKTITLTTDGDSGVSTLDQVTGVLNIPNYSNGASTIPSLQQVLYIGNEAENAITLTFGGLGQMIYSGFKTAYTDTTNRDITLFYVEGISTGGLSFALPSNKPDGGYILATVDDIPIPADSPITIVNDSSLFSTGLVGTGLDSNATNSIFLGEYAGYEATDAGSSNFFGSGTGNGATNASNSNFLGQEAGLQATNANDSNFLGYSAGENAIDAAYSNLLGYKVGSSFTDNNISSNNIIIGTNISLPNEATNSINLGGVLFGTGTYFEVSNDPSITPVSGGKIGIGVVEPTNTLHIYSEAANTSGLRLERLTSASPSSTGKLIGVDSSGNVVTLEGAGGGGSSVNYYLNGGTSQGTFGGTTYYEFSKTAVIGTGADFNRNTNGYIASFITDVADPSLLLIPAGNWNLEFFFSSSSAGGSPSFYAELYKYDGTTFTLIASGSAVPEGITNGISIDAYFTALAVPETVLTVNDRLAIRVYVNASSKTITLHTQNGHLCEVITTFTAGLTALNGLQAQVQNFATGTTGTDFAINSSGSTHTFNLPDASATARGAITTGTQTIAGAKTFTSAIRIPDPVPANPIGVRCIVLGDPFGSLLVGSTTIYPDAQEMQRVKGVTSDIQTQFTNLTTDLAGKISKNVATTYTTNTITTVTAAEYAAIGTKDANTLYFIV
jgi:hypothetical protein